MAVLKGTGSMKDVNLVGRIYDNAYSKNGKTGFVDLQVDARDQRGPGQVNLHLKSERQKLDDGRTVYNNTAAYSADQVQTMLEAAGDQVQPILNKEGVEIGKEFCVKGDLMTSSSSTGLVLNTKTVGASDFKIDDKTIDNQFASMKEAKEARAAERAAAKEAPEVAAEVTTEVEMEQEEPALG